MIYLFKTTVHSARESDEVATFYPKKCNVNIADIHNKTTTVGDIVEHNWYYTISDATIKKKS